MQQSQITTAEEAAFIYHIVLHGLVHSFKPSDVPDFRHRGDKIKSIVVPGVLVREEKKPAWLKIVLEPESFHEPEMMRRFNAMTSASVRAPKIRIRGETSAGYPFFVSDDVGGAHLLDPAAYGSGNPHSTWAQKHDIADAHWKVLDALLSDNGLPSNGPAPEIWFDDKIHEWLMRAEQNGAIQKRLLAPATLTHAIEVLRRASEHIAAPGTYFSHAHFSNPEVRIQSDTVKLIDWGSAKFVPLMYDAAFWVWNAALYSWGIGTKEWIFEVEDYEDAFSDRGRHVGGVDYDEADLRHAFRTALLERMLGALLVDCAESEPASQPISRQRQIVQNCRVTLKALVASLED